jgi:plastocyanin
MKKFSYALALLLGAALLAACGPPPPAEFTIDMDEYSFTPETLEVEVGQEVTITLVNIGELDHEFMIGQGVVNDSEGRPSGFQVDFFAAAGVTPEVSGGGMLMDHSEEHSADEMEDSDEHSDEGDMEGMDHSQEEMDMAVNMVMLPVGADETTIHFTVTEEMLGIWEIGCFEQDGVHYTSGMKGTLIVRQ